MTILGVRAGRYEIRRPPAWTPDLRDGGPWTIGAGLNQWMSSLRIHEAGLRQHRCIGAKSHQGPDELDQPHHDEEHQKEGRRGGAEGGEGQEAAARQKGPATAGFALTVIVHSTGSLPYRAGTGQDPRLFQRARPDAPIKDGMPLRSPAPGGSFRTGRAPAIQAFGHEP